MQFFFQSGCDHDSLQIFLYYLWILHKFLGKTKKVAYCLLFSLEFFHLLDWLPSQARSSCLLCYLTHSWWVIRRDRFMLSLRTFLWKWMKHTTQEFELGWVHTKWKWEFKRLLNCKLIKNLQTLQQEIFVLLARFCLSDIYDCLSSF